MSPTTPSPAKPRWWSAHACALVLIFTVAAALRLYDLSHVPGELIADEIDLYDSMHSVVTTGHDVDGTLLPFFATAFTRNPPIYGIVGYASTLALGKNPFAWRLPAAIMGLIAVALLYGIAYELTRRRDVAIVAALIMATQPIFVHFSRIGWEPGSELPFLLGGLYLLARTFRRSDETNARLTLSGFFWAALLLAIACYTYMAAWFYAIVLAGALLLVNAGRFRLRANRTALAGALALWLVLSAPAFWMIFFDPAAVARTQRMATFATGISLDALATFARNYAAHFRWSYLVTTGDPQTGTTWRYLVGFGAFYAWVVALAGLGLLTARWFTRARWARWWIYIWLVAYPLGGALTTDGVPNAPRTLAGAPVFCLLAAIGFTALADGARALVRPRWRTAVTDVIQTLLVAGTAVSVVWFSAFYFVRYPRVYPNAWGSGSQATFAFVRAHATGYARVCFMLYPAFYEIDTYARYYLSGVPLERIENQPSPVCSLPGTMLVVDTNHETPPPFFRVLATIRDINGLPFSVIMGRPLAPS